MKKLHFETTIHASPEKVWNSIVDDKKFRKWTVAFHEGSYFEGGWEKGDDIRFLVRDEKGGKMGMVAKIEESKKYSYISIKHFGNVIGDVEDTTSDEVKKWAPAYENYTLSKIGDDTKFVVDMDAGEDSIEMFSKMWPEALKILKKISEN
jgi:hypothetical protein